MQMFKPVIAVDSKEKWQRETDRNTKEKNSFPTTKLYLSFME